MACLSGAMAGLSNYMSHIVEEAVRWCSLGVVAVDSGSQKLGVVCQEPDKDWEVRVDTSQQLSCAVGGSNLHMFVGLRTHVLPVTVCRTTANKPTTAVCMPRLCLCLHRCCHLR